MKSVYETELPGIPLFTRGKVRDVYDLDDKLLIVATDRISAYDVVMPNGIPGKGAVLTQMSLFWFELVKDIVPNHLISADVNDFPPELQAHRDILRDRSMLVRKAERYDIECVARGYITGSGWSQYKRDGKVCGIDLPAGLQESQILDPPLFTPSTKAETGHDENITFEEMVAVIGDRSVSEQLRDLTLAVYSSAREYAASRGIIIADTKFEFGMIDGRITLIDEILSPDSSRFWPQDSYAPGRGQDSFDKQFVRDYLGTLDWDKSPPAPALPDHIIEQTLEKYLEASRRLLDD